MIKYALKSTKEEISKMSKIYLEHPDDTLIKEKLIRVHIYLLYKIINKYIQLNPNKKNDILSVGLLGLCEGLNKWKGEKDNLTNYLRLTIRGYIIRFLIKDQTIYIPVSNIKKQLKEYGELIFIQNYISLNGLDKEKYNDKILDKIMEKEEIKLIKKSLPNKDKIILELRLEGYTYSEIAERIGKSIGWISKKIKSLKNNTNIKTLFNC